MIDCKKRQREFINSELQHRCMEQKASTYLNVVGESTCANCPIYRPNRLPVIQENQYPPCQFRSHHGGTVCNATGLPVTPAACNKCVKIVSDSTTFLERMVGYADAVKKWVANGSPTRTDEQVKDLWERCCSKCKMYNQEKKACNSCGCAVSDGGFPLTNKLKMKTESCPLGQF